VKIALVVLGLALALYGVASLTGGWLGEPPWWKTEFERMQDEFEAHQPRDGESRIMQGKSQPWHDDATGGSVAVSLAITLAGGALAAIAWPRKPRTRRGAW
jgi:hypothetical protein